MTHLVTGDDDVLLLLRFHQDVANHRVNSLRGVWVVWLRGFGGREGERERGREGERLIKTESQLHTSIYMHTQHAKHTHTPPYTSMVTLECTILSVYLLVSSSSYLETFGVLR